MGDDTRWYCFGFFKSSNALTPDVNFPSDVGGSFREEPKTFSAI